MCGLLLLVVNYLNCCYTFLVQAKLKYITTMKEFYVSLDCFKFVIFALFYFGRLCALVYVTQFELSPLYENVNKEFAWITISTFFPFILTGLTVNVKIFTPRQIDQQAVGSVTRLCEEASVRSGKWGVGEGQEIWVTVMVDGNWHIRPLLQFSSLLLRTSYTYFYICYPARLSSLLWSRFFWFPLFLA